MKFVIAMSTLLFAASPVAMAGDFACPDEQSQELLDTVRELDSVYPLAKAESGYARVIEQASRRTMDDLPLRQACVSLAGRTFRTNCSDYGYKCPHPGDDVWGEETVHMNDWIPELKANVPALRSCPDAYLRIGRKLPIVRAVPEFPSEVVDKGNTGWVEVALDVDEFGVVANAEVTSSTSFQLEAPALDAARRFRYKKKIVGNRFVAVGSVSAVIHFYYWSLAKAAGCPISWE